MFQKTMRFLVVALAALTWEAGAQGQTFQLLTDGWNALVQKHVRTNGGINYIGMEQDQVQLDAFIKGYANLDFKGMDDKGRKAAYINLYNATMIAHLLRYAKEQKLDVKARAFTGLKINEIKVKGGNIWNGDYKVTLAGHAVTLDDIEHGLLRGGAKGELEPLRVSVLDPRIHVAVNCAALSCPRIREVAYRASNVDSMLTENLQEFLASERQFRKVSDDKMQANSIVYWYYGDFDDFGKSQKLRGAGDYLAQFVEAGAKDHDWKVRHLQDHFNDRTRIGLKLTSAFTFDYDWRVNDVRNK